MLKPLKKRPSNAGDSGEGSQLASLAVVEERMRLDTMTTHHDVGVGLEDPRIAKQFIGREISTPPWPPYFRSLGQWYSFTDPLTENNRFHADVEVAVFASLAETFAVRFLCKSCSIASATAGLEKR